MPAVYFLRTLIAHSVSITRPARRCRMLWMNWLLFLYIVCCLLFHLFLCSIYGEQSCNESTRRKNHEGKSLEYGRRVPQNLESETLMQIFPRFCHVSEFKAPYCLHCNARRGHGQKVPLEIHQNTPFQTKKIIFIARRHVSAVYMAVVVCLTQSCTTVDPTDGSGRVRSGWVG